MEKKRPTTKRTKKQKSEVEDDLRPHYDFDYSKAKPNRFAHRRREQMLVLLDKDLTRTFRTPEQVMHALRSLVDAMLTKRKHTPAAS
ncbi:MAG: hypothetical protein Q8922_12495 [Bacteroidota bacterium]|nr:hypothetical protein [Bacteroidota bacterium]MDP4232216.1 hypothetical protein [Bacteroidota bacterium]MDP4243603.1 hypothetical protein [Bacteroidota bacterium]MDP4288744.1 hypothetical protein [Bacteroidota bacterium]